MLAQTTVSSKTWQIYPVSRFTPKQVEYYWQTLYMHDSLKFRICDVVNPTWADAKDMIMRMFKTMWCIWDEEKQRITCEFMLESFTGKAAQIHFSMHPENDFKYSLQIGQGVTDEILNEWQYPDLHTLFGLTPETNRAARLFIHRVGFKTVGRLPAGMYDRGKLVNAVITTKQRTV